MAGRISNKTDTWLPAVGLEDINQKEVDKEAMEEAIFFQNYKEMKQDLQGFKKLEEIKHNDFTKMPEYMEDKSLENARMAFRIKSKMVQSIKMNYKGIIRKTSL